MRLTRSILCASVAFCALPAAAQTLDEAIAEVIAITTFEGDPSTNSDNISAVSLTIAEDCSAVMTVNMNERNLPLSATATGNLAAFEPTGFQVDGVRTTEMDMETREGQDPWRISAVIGNDHPIFEEIRSSISAGEIVGRCETEICSIDQAFEDFVVPLPGLDAETDGDRAVAAYETLIALCIAQTN